MSLTPNYGFNIPTGSDAVNLLTQNYPNFTSLDSILKTIELTGTTTATVSKVGTVFQLVRTNSALNVIRFVATGNYVAGDTFTIDGVAVTATSMQGTSLESGAFVINQSVLCILNQSVLTVLVSGSASNDASDIDYDNTGSGLTATNVQDAIDEVKADIPSIPATYDADDIVYDNKGSGLAATNVQDAIDEIATSAPGASVQVVADGVSTIKTLLNNLHSLIDFTKVNAKSVIYFREATESRTFKLYSRTTGNTLTFNTFWQNVGASWNLWTFKVDATNSTLISGANGTGTDNPNAIIANGTVIELIY